MADIKKGVGEVTGNVAHDAADSGNPVKVGGKAETGTPAAVADGDRVDAWFDARGALTTTLVDHNGVGSHDATTGGVMVSPSGNTLEVMGDAGHDLTDPAGSFPIKIGGKAESTTPTPVADGDRVAAWFTTLGELVTNDQTLETNLETFVDNANYTMGSSRVFPVGGYYHPAPTALDASDIGIIRINASHEVVTSSHPDNFISTNNSTTATLGISGVFTGTGDDVSTYASVSIQLDSSHDSATDGMTFQFSTDNTNWDDVYTFTYTAADGARRFQFPVTAQYFRIVYTNGGTGQTHFRVQTILHAEPIQTSIHRLVDNTHPDRSANVVKAAIIAQSAGAGDFIPVAATAGGALKMDFEEIAGTTASVDAGASDAGTQRVVIAADASDAAITENPVPIGGRASTAVPTAVSADGDAVMAWLDRQGAQKTVMVDDAGDSCMDGTNDALRVNVVAGAAGGVTHTDNATFTGGSDDGVPAFAVYDTTPPTITDGNAGAVRMDSVRNMHMVIRDGAVNERAANVNASNQLEVSVGNSPTVDTELPAAAALADNTADPTAPAVGAFGMAFDGTNWDKMRGDQTDGLLVNLGSNNDVTVTGSVTADLGANNDIQGDVAHDAADTGNPLSTGYNAVEFAADPPVVSADNDRVRGIATPQGIQWTLGGHPNIVTREYMTTAAQTNDEIIASVAAGSHIVVTEIEAMVDNACSVDVKVRIGFGATGTVPTEPASGATVDGMVLSHPGIAPGSGVVRGSGAGVIAVGGDGLELGISNEVPTGGRLTVIVSYYVTTL